MKSILENTKVTVAVGVVGLILIVIGIVDRSGAYDMADYQKARLDKAISELEAASGTPREDELREEVEKVASYLDSDLKSGAMRTDGAMKWILLGTLLSAFCLVQSLRLRKAGSEPSEPSGPVADSIETAEEEPSEHVSEEL